ncbi:SCP2 sterol-binding domain-containing protein [Actinomadura parmotrematis]|uniref:SCP2 sterol-binding domain-containing protein n=1 Tax=Actinomadura parmotrematis TaxID=2864039 RepID=A0ABS7FSJ1_9ACTN|nr:SCP2 sterol-binding domain-containing protein [Actinomadura parmotrematis]MBW8483175.1 SCP2 sterol-binding domain-containing protein [Actinomadura parmotrematis]
MANEEECRAALDRIALRLAEVDGDKLAEHVVERTVSCRVPDLGLAFRTRLHAGGLDPFEPADDPKSAQVRLTVSSDDLVALAADTLSPAKAWASGRLKIEASIFDLLRLRKVL